MKHPLDVVTEQHLQHVRCLMSPPAVAEKWGPRAGGLPGARAVLVVGNSWWFHNGFLGFHWNSWNIGAAWRLILAATKVGGVMGIFPGIEG